MRPWRTLESRFAALPCGIPISSRTISPSGHHTPPRGSHPGKILPRNSSVARVCGTRAVRRGASGGAPWVRLPRPASLSAICQPTLIALTPRLSSRWPTSGMAIHLPRSGRESAAVPGESPGRSLGRRPWSTTTACYSAFRMVGAATNGVVRGVSRSRYQGARIRANYIS